MTSTPEGLAPSQSLNVHRTRRFRAALLVGAAALAAAGAASGETLRIGLQDDPDTLDPAKNWTFVGRHVLAAMCDKLVDVGPDQAIQPQLATEWSTAADGKSITFKLRPGVVFHDGEPFDAEAARYSLERALKLPDSRRKSEIAAVSRVEAVDRLTLRVELAAPFAPLLAQFADRAGIMVSPKAAEAAGDRFATHPVCAGPYRFVERVVQDRIVLEKFDRHRDAAHHAFQRVSYVAIPDGTVRLANLRSGQLDLIERLSPNDIDTARRSGLGVAAVTGLGYQGITFNIANGDRPGPFGTNPKLREAFELALDRNVLNEVVFAGEYTVGNQPVPPDSVFYVKELPPPARDVARAARLVAESGVAQPKLTLLTPNNNELSQAAQIIQSMAQEAGIAVELQAIEFVTMLQQAKEGKFDADLVGWSGRVDPDGNIATLLACKASGNDGRYCSAELDRRLEEGRGASAPEDRRRAYAEVISILLADRPILYLWHQKWIYAMSARLTGFVPHPDGLMRLGGLSLRP